MFKEKLEKILKNNLVLPILKLRETHPDTFITEQGYKTLVDNAEQEILSLIADELPKEKEVVMIPLYQSDGKGGKVCVGHTEEKDDWQSVGFNQCLKEVKTKLGGEMK